MEMQTMLQTNPKRKATKKTVKPAIVKPKVSANRDHDHGLSGPKPFQGIVVKARFPLGEWEDIPVEAGF
jgi:hypothetical protein